MQLPAKKCIYTVVTQGYDALFAPLVPQPGWDLLYFTDDPEAIEASGPWQVRPLPQLPEMEGLPGEDVRRARLVKMLPHRFLEEYEYSVYIDGNRLLDDDMSGYIEAQEDDRLLCLAPRHADAYAAAETLLARKASRSPFALDPAPPLAPAEAEALQKQVKRWKKAGLPPGGGCPGTAVLGRRHHDKKVQAVMETWAGEVLQGCAQDEPALPHACHVRKTGWTAGLSQQVGPGDAFSPAEGLALPLPHRALMLGDAPLAPREYPPNPPPPGGKYEGYPLLLTIGVPVSNQIGTIRRCLEGIRPLLEGLDAELVVVDTGSTDGTVEVCREFGARVVEFPWIHDMSAARNTAVRNARGLWYMSIDDDEWFEDVTPFFDFFKDPKKYKQHRIATYVQLNYMDEFAKHTQPYQAVRMARRDESLHFEGRIHDAISLAGPMGEGYHIPAEAKHFGFAQTSLHNSLQKARRNVVPLKLDMAQYPTDMRYAAQMAKELIIGGDVRGTLLCVYWGMAALRLGSQGHFDKLLPEQGIVYYYRRLTARQGLRFARRHVRPEGYRLGEQCAILYALATLHHASRDFGEALDTIERYEKARKKFLALSTQEQYTQNDLLALNLYQDAYAENLSKIKLQCLWALGREAAAATLSASAGVAEMLDTTLGYRETLLAGAVQGQRWPLLGQVLAQRLALGSDRLFGLYPVLDEVATEADLPDLLAVLEDIKAPASAYEPLLRLRALPPGDDAAPGLLAQGIEGLAAMVAEPAQYGKMHLLFQALRQELSPAPVLAAMAMQDADYITQFVQPGKTEMQDQLYTAFYAWQQEPHEDESGLTLYLLVQLGLLALARREDEAEKDPEAYLALFETVLQRQERWAREVYAPGLLEGTGSPLLPASIHGVCLMRQAARLREEGDVPGALRLYRDALKTDIRLRRPAKLLAEAAAAAAEEKLEEGRRKTDEFQALLDGILPKLEQMIDAGMAQEAVGALSQLEGMVPGHPDIQRLRQKAGLLPPS